MRQLIYIIFICFAFSSNAQEINIYSKWAAKIDDDVILILDISKAHSMAATRIKILDDNHYRIDSFGYKRKFNTTFIDLDSSVIWWSGALTPLHPNIQTEFSFGMIEIVETNYRDIPQTIKFSGDLPDLAIYLDEDDTITFTRMISRYEDETEYFYYTRYGGEISYSNYFGEHGGFSMGIRDVGLKFSPVKLNKSVEQKLTSEVIKKTNNLRLERGVEGLHHDLVLDSASRDNLNAWIKESKKQHRLNSNPEFENISKIDSSIYLSLFNKFNIINYPFRCGENATAIQFTSVNISRKREIRKYVKSHSQDYIDALFAAWLNNSGLKQNILNSGYAGVGNSVALYEAIKDDYYFDHTGKKVSIRDKKVKYYYLVFTQTFSEFEKQ